MNIGEFSKKSKISIDTLRYYDKIALLIPERVNNIRQYTLEDLSVVHVIFKLKTSGFSLDEIKQMFQLEKAIENHDMTSLFVLEDLMLEKQKLITKQMDQLNLSLKMMRKALLKIDEVKQNPTKIQEIMEAK